jgi:DNA-3-methyladenine glycosylase I
LLTSEDTEQNITGEEEVRRNLGNALTTQNECKVHACIENPRTTSRIVDWSYSFASVVQSSPAMHPPENPTLLKEELQYVFSGIGEIASYDVLTEIGMPVLKPDRVICRTFRRLRLILRAKQLLKTVV